MPEVVRTSGTAPDPEIVRRAARVLARGDLIVYPTDTLYALGGLAVVAAVARAVRRAKGRDDAKPLPLIVADVDQARGLARSWPPAAAALSERLWPGPLTLVIAAGESVPGEVTSGTGSVAVRVPALPLARALCAAAGPLVSTSANLAGEPPPLTCAKALEGVGHAAALALDAGPGQPFPSTIVDVSGGGAVLVRAGAVPWEEVVAVLRSRPR